MPASKDEIAASAAKAKSGIFLAALEASTDGTPAAKALAAFIGTTDAAAVDLISAVAEMSETNSVDTLNEAVVAVSRLAGILLYASMRAGKCDLRHMPPEAMTISLMLVTCACREAIEGAIAEDRNA